MAALCVFCLRETGSLVSKIISLALVLVVGLLVIIDGRDLVLSNLDPRLTNWAAEQMGAEDFAVGTVTFSLGEGEDPAGLVLNDLEISQGDSGPGLRVPKLETGFQVLSGLSGRVRPTSLDVAGVSIAFARAPDGTVTLGTGREGAPDLPIFTGGGQAAPINFAALASATEIIDGVAMLSAMDRVALSDLDLRFADVRANRFWQAENATAYLRRDETGQTSAGFAAVLEEAGRGAQVRVSATMGPGSAAGRLRYSFTFDGARPADIAAQVSVLDWMSVIDAPVDGALAAEFAADGSVASLTGTLSIGAGALRPRNGQPVAFNAAKAHFGYDPAEDRFDVSLLELDTERGRFSASGPVLITRGEESRIEALVGQVALSDITLKANAVLSEAVDFATGTAVARVRFAPFSVEIGTLRLSDGPASVDVTGQIAARTGSWDVSLDLNVSDLSRDRVVALWPEGFRPNLRKWIDRKIEQGRITKATSYFRQSNGEKTAALDFSFTDGVARIFPDMPALVNASGHGQIVGGRFDLVLSEGQTGPGAGQGIDLAGSRMLIADARQKPAIAEIFLGGDGAIGDFLKLVDNPPLRFLSRLNKGTDFATGRARVASALTFELRKGLTPMDVAATVSADLFDVDAPTLVPGRPIKAEHLQLNADNSALVVSGPLEFGEVPVTATYTQPIGRDVDPPHVSGTMSVTPETVAALGIPLPADSLGGNGEGRFHIALQRDAPPRYSAEVNLRDAHVNIPALGWTKSAGKSGQLSVAGALGKRPTVERLSLSGPGLTLSGALDLGEGGLVGAQFDRLALGQWLDAPVTWRPGGTAPTRIAIRGGTVDLRNGLPPMPGGGGGAVHLDFAPDRVIVGDKIRLTGVTGELETGKSPMGRFRGNLNGQAPITGVLRDSGEVFLQAENGGDALRAAGVFRNAIGGTLRVALRTGDGPIHGAFSLKEAAVISNGAVAQLLEEADARKLARQVAASGISIEDAQGQFRIENGKVRLSRARAIGPSVGITLGGSYDMTRGVLDLSGVVSPFYLVNGLFQRIPILGRALGGRPGEGLLGANFTITGSASGPDISVNPLSVLTPGATRELLETRTGATPGG